MSAAASSGSEPQSCDSCDRRSLLPHFDSWGRCPACRRSLPGVTPGSVVYTILLVAVAIGVGDDLDPGRVPAALLAIYPLSLLNIVLHEATHALVATLLGWRVHAVAIGTQQPWFRLRLGRTLLVVHSRLLGGGHCLAAPEAGAPSARAIAAFVSAPMVMHATAAAVSLRWVSGDSFGGVLAAMFAATNVFLIVSNAWPRHLPHSGVATDGKALLDLWRSREAELVKWRIGAGLCSIQTHMLEGRPEEAFKAAERIFALEPGNEAAAVCLAAAAHAAGRGEHALPHLDAYAKAIEESRPRSQRNLGDRLLAAQGLFRGAELEAYMRGSLLVALDRLDEVLDLSERRLAAATSDEARALWQGCVALALLLAGKDLDRAEEAARWAYDRLPWVPFVETAWGMTRIERGDLDEGLAAFARTRKIDREGRMSSLHAAWTAVAHAREGERERAERLAATLRVAGVWPACLRRAERALSGGC